MEATDRSGYDFLKILSDQVKYINKLFSANAGDATKAVEVLEANLDYVIKTRDYRTEITKKDDKGQETKVEMSIYESEKDLIEYEFKTKIQKFKMPNSNEINPQHAFQYNLRLNDRAFAIFKALQRVIGRNDLLPEQKGIYDEDKTPVLTPEEINQ